jgi:hypothetical protein
VVEIGDHATWAAAGIAVVAAVFAHKQPREARKSRIAAKPQATEAAAKSRTAAEAQVHAAGEQVALLRAERDEGGAPAFSVSAVDARTMDILTAAKIVLRLDRGRALRLLIITAFDELGQECLAITSPDIHATR